LPFGFLYAFFMLLKFDTCTINTTPLDLIILILFRYGMDGPGLIPGMANFFFTTTSKPTLGPSQPFIQWVPGEIFPGVKWPGLEADHSPLSSVEDKNSTVIYPLPSTYSGRDT
jgi:hypothetical protein